MRCPLSVSGEGVDHVTGNVMQVKRRSSIPVTVQRAAYAQVSHRRNEV